MIAMVEGAKRQKTPNEIALNILLAALTIIFLVVVVALQPMSQYSVDAAGKGERGVDHRAGGPAGLPGSHDHRRAAVGHRHRRHEPPEPGQRGGHVRPGGGGGRRRGRAAARQDRHHHPGQPAGDGVRAGAGGRHGRTGRRRPAGLAGRRDARGPQHRGPGQERSTVCAAGTSSSSGRHLRALHRPDAHERRRPGRPARSARERPTRWRRS